MIRCYKQIIFFAILQNLKIVHFDFIGNHNLPSAKSLQDEAAQQARKPGQYGNLFTYIVALAFSLLF